MKKEFKKICVESSLIGAQMLVLNDKKILEDLSFGVRDIETKEKINKYTKARIASISKIIVAICVMQLVEKGLISIDDDISDIFGFKIRNPKFPNDKITIKHLMTQTSSITDGFDDEDPKNDHIKRGYNGVNGTNQPATLKDLLIKNDGPYWIDSTYSDVRPGERFIYSNFGCGLLACVVEKITQTYFCDYVVENFLLKLNIDGGFRIQDIKDKDNFATLYRMSKSKEKIVSTLSIKGLLNWKYNLFPLGENYRGPAGGLMINLNDLAKIMQLFMNGGVYKGVRILNKKTIDLMQQFHWINTEFDDYKAKGLQIKIFSMYEKELLRGHTGSAYGLVSFFFYNPEQKIGMCFFTNGGLYKHNPYGIVDIFVKLMEKGIEKYWKHGCKRTFVINKNSLEASINDRILTMPRAIFEKEGKTYISLFTALDGLDIMPVVTKDLILLSKNYKKVAYRFEEMIKIEDTYYLPIKDLLESLEIDYSENEKTINIKYLS